MTTYEVRAHVGADGVLTVRMPAEFEGSDVRVVVEKHPAINGRAPLPRTPEERVAALDRIAGSITDPTFVRPPQGEFETRESLD